jgi:8-oxo-dGTP pyrophosphatase MutT (NUDIX family)
MQRKHRKKKQEMVAGVVILNTKGTHVVVVQQDKDNYGFPKGGGKRGETCFKTAFRELQEETGLGQHQVHLLSRDFLKETSRKGNIAVCYLVATVDDCFGPGSSYAFSYDHKEIDDVQWRSIENALALLRPQRQEVLKAALKRLNKDKR